MRVLNQPFKEALGPIIIDNLTKPNYNAFTFISAYAKSSGVERLRESMVSFKNAGGRIVSFIGVDQKNTSYEALLALHGLCDELYIVHSENLSSTFHHKLYSFTSQDSTWTAIGSNNLTAGGLWTNYESTMIWEYDLSIEEEVNEYTKVKELFELYSSSTYQCSIMITDVKQIEDLLSEDYIAKEADMARSLKLPSNSGKSKERKPMFGSESFKSPALPRSSDSAIEEVIDDTSSELDISDNNSEAMKPITPTEPSSINATRNEIFWFEMRASTGGSRNILDLSMIGKIAKGSVKGTAYETQNTTQTLGGVKFFEVDPTSHSTVKNITINFEGHDYFPSTILFATNNGSWRLQLKGEAEGAKTPLSEFGRTRFAHNILIFEKINSDKYKLKVVDGNDIDDIKDKSIFYAHNGRTKTSKLFGKL